MCVPIQRVRRDTAGVITHVGGSTSDGSPWGLTVAEAVSLQESLIYSFFVEVPAGKVATVLVKASSAGRKYLTTSPDGVAANNLDALPDMPNSLAGVEPPFPLNIPGTAMTRLMSIRSIRYVENHVLWYLQVTPIGVLNTDEARGYPVESDFWRATPRWIYVSAIAPFPAEIMVFENSVALERVPGDDPARRYALEAAGSGWWTLEYVLTTPDGTIDPTRPNRINEIKIVIRPGTNAWSQRDMRLQVSAFTINAYCLRLSPADTSAHSPNGSSIAFRVFQKTAPPPPPPPATAKMPALVGLRLDKALITLYGLGLKKVYVNVATPVASDYKVDTQDPAANSTVKVTDPVYLTASLGQPETGFQKIVVSNQSGRAKPLDLWLFDYNLGAWAKSTTVAYQAQEDVVLAGGHTYLLAAVDPSLLNCHRGHPEEASCVYFAPQGNFMGDSSGPALALQID